jgi:hypothetical protein
MGAETAFEKETKERLDRMDRELRRWRVAGIATLALGTIVAAVAMAEPPARELRVETLRIVDQSGRERIVLTAVPGVPDMTFLDANGQTRLTLDIADDSKPVLVISESGQAKGRLTLGIENGSPTLQLYDREGVKRVTIGIPRDIGALIRTYDAHGKVQGRFP